jgi:hypothetical protein
MTITPSSEVRLCNVPFLIDYKDTMDFSDKTAQTNYFLGKTIANGNVGDDFSYVRQSQSIKVPIECDFIRNCNYMMYKNDLYSNKWFYAFVTEVRYVNPNTTEIFFTVDVFQTWQFDITFKQSFIERCHVDRWNSDGTPILNTQDEGIAYGSEYDIVSIDHFQPSGGIYFLVIACKNLLEGSNEITPVLNGIVQPLTYYIHPFKLDGTMPPTTIGGAAQPIIDLKTLLYFLYLEQDSVNNVVSLTVTDYIGENVDYDGTVHLSSNEFEGVLFGTGNNPIIKLIGMSSYETNSKNFGNKYDDYNDVYNESKLLMYPYTQLVLSDGKGHQVTYKNEYINSSDLTVTVRGSLNTTNKVAYSIEGYNVNPSQSNHHIHDLSYSLINSDPNDVPILTDLLSAYLQGNRNSLNNQKAQMQFNLNMSEVTGSMAVAKSVVSGGLSGSVGGAGGAISGAVLGGVESGLGVYQGIRNQQYAIEGIMARQKDIANTPPSISGMGSNTAFDFGNNINGVYLIKKQIKLEYIAQIADYFKMFGYKINKKRTPDFKSREHFNYIKTNGVTILGNCPQNDLNQIKAIFDNGVTVWHVDDVGNYSLANNEV